MTSSISLPNWQYHRFKVLAAEGQTIWLYKRYRMLLRYAARSHMVSDRQMQYNRKEYSYEKLTVRWDVGMYNRLRMAAHRLRISLSFMVHLIMLKDLKDVPSRGSYHRKEHFTPQNGLVFTEIIKYVTEPPDF